MSRFEGPQGIVTQGLVLNLDAGDPDSFTRQFPFYCDALIVAGGGSGGVDNGGGGGGGGVLDKRNLQLLINTAYTITVGAGGAARPGSSDDGPGNNGSNTTALGYTAIGGGGGSGWVNTALPPGQSSYVGGSGAGQSNSAGAGNSLGVGIALQPTSSDGGMGYNGGAASPPYAGGGGGAGGPGGNAGSGFAGNGGNGYFLNGAYGPGLGVSDIVGAGGAGGWDVISGYSSNPVPTAQNGTIKKTTQTAEDPATSNSGAGGNGGNHNNNSSGAGGSGVVVICYPGLPAATGGDILYQNGKTYHRFFSSGTFTPYKWNDVTGNDRNATLNGLVTGSMQTNGGILSVYNPVVGLGQPDFFNFSPGSTSGYNPMNYANCSVTVAFRWNATNDYWERVFDFGRGGNNSGTYAQNAFIFTRYSTTSDLHIITHGGPSNVNVKIGELNIGTWQIYTITWTAGSQIYYKNGSVYTSTTSAGSLVDYFGATRTDEQYYLGKSNWNDGGSRISYGAFMIHNRVLSAAEVTQMYNALKNRYGL